MPSGPSRSPIWPCALAAWIGLSAIPAAAGDAPAPVGLTIEIEWTWPPLPNLPDGPAPAPPPIVLEPSGDAHVLDVVAWPATAPGTPEELADGTWRLGYARSGRARARVEAPLSATLIVRAGTNATAFPIANVIEAPRQSLAGAPVALTMRRVAWDALEVQVDGPASSGTAAPGTVVPVRVGLNVLTAEPTEGVARLIAELRPARGGDPLWRYDQNHLVATNPAAGQVPIVPLSIPMPSLEGSYVLDLRSYWGPSQAQGASRLSQLLRRRRAPEPIQTARRVSLAVLGAPREPTAADNADTGQTAAKGPETATPIGAPEKPGVAVDSIDLGRLRGGRPLAVGRAAPTVPWALPDEARLRASDFDLRVGGRLRGWVGLGPDAATLGAPDAEGWAWTALGLYVPHPGRAHRLALTVASGDPASLTVALVAPPDESTGTPARVVLEAPVMDRPADAQGPNGAWLVWPDRPGMVLVVVNRGPGGPVRLGSVVLEELPEETVSTPTPPTPSAAGTTGRSVGLVIGSERDLARFGGPGDVIATARHLASYLDLCGGDLVVLPSWLADRARRRDLGGQAHEDPIGPDRLEIVLRALAERSRGALLDLRCDGPLPGLPDALAPQSAARGLALVDGQGRAGPSDPAYNLLNPEVRDALKRHAESALALRGTHANLQGLLIRLGPGASLAGAAETGLDDAGYARFLAEMLDAEIARRAPGRDPNDPQRFAARRQYVLEQGRAPWLTWRARQVGAFYAELAAAVEQAAPGAVLAVATPVLDDSQAGRQARRSDRHGEPPRAAWQALGLDLALWPAPPPNLVVLRGVAPGPEPLSSDLATHPDLDATLARQPRRGLLWAMPPGIDDDNDDSLALRMISPRAARDEPLGHAVAVLDAHWAFVSVAASAGREDQLAQFARVLHALPAAPPTRTSPRPESGVAGRSWTGAGGTILGLANDTPYAIRLDALVRAPADAPIEELGRGVRIVPETVPNRSERRLVLELPAFGTAAIRVGAQGAFLDPIELHPPEDVMAAQYKALSAQLSRLTQGVGRGGPPNPGFEPAPAEAGVVRTVNAGAVPGWSAGEGAALAIDSTRPHGGVGSLRIGPPGAAISAVFQPPGGTTLVLRGWFRAEAPQTKLRVWFEGEGDDQPILRRADVTIGVEWAEQRIGLSNLPGRGLDRLRLRFEPLAPGTVWVDDLALVGQRLSEPDLRARETLIAATQSFRERRFASFARLAGSYWAHSASLLGEALRISNSGPERRLR